MSDFIDKFTEYLKNKEASPKTIINYLADIRHFAKWFSECNGRDLTLEEITPTDIREYKSYLLTVERREPATINRRLSTLRRLCTWAKREGLIDDNPIEDIKGVEKVKMNPKSLEKVENIVKKYARAAGLDDVSPHTLRHTFGKLVLDAGEDLVTVAKLLGHERLETTAIYTQPNQRDLERAV